jgi:hypothetical protein
VIAVRLFGGLALERDGSAIAPPGRLHARLLLARAALSHLRAAATPIWRLGGAINR